MKAVWEAFVKMMEAFDKTISSTTTAEEADAVWEANIDAVWEAFDAVWEAIDESKTKTTAQEAHAGAACKATFKMMDTMDKTARSPKAQEVEAVWEAINETIEVTDDMMEAIEKRVEAIEKIRMAEIEKVRASKAKEAFADLKRKIDSMTQEDWDRIPLPDYY